MQYTFHSTRLGLYCKCSTSTHALDLYLVSIFAHVKLLSEIMITDVQLSIFANILGVTLFMLVVLYHYIVANNPKNKQ